MLVCSKCFKDKNPECFSERTKVCRECVNAALRYKYHNNQLYKKQQLEKSKATAATRKEYFRTYAKIHNKINWQKPEFREASLIRQRKFHSKDTKHKFRQIKWLYGLTEKDYTQMLKSQNNACKLCGEENKKLIVEHDHKNNVVRGLTCHRCNTIIAGYENAITIGLNKVKAYLGESEC